ncbi:hypothetical protein [Xanthobacter flavus]|uniref:hypothetical protein n=1 Tax=Xanthobacter flavus TaxID=281 RepID=UPI00372B0E9E
MTLPGVHKVKHPSATWLGVRTHRAAIPDCSEAPMAEDGLLLDEAASLDALMACCSEIGRDVNAAANCIVVAVTAT